MKRPLEVAAEGVLPGRASRCSSRSTRDDDCCARPPGLRDAAGLATRIAWPPRRCRRPRLERARHDGSLDRPDGSSAWPSRDHFAPTHPSARLVDRRSDPRCAVPFRSAPAHELVVSRRTILSIADRTDAGLLIPPRFVEGPTSVETVTTRSSTAAPRAQVERSARSCCVERWPLCSRPRSSGPTLSRGGPALRVSRRAALAHARPPACSRRTVVQVSGSAPRVSASADCSAEHAACCRVALVRSCQPLIV